MQHIAVPDRGCFHLSLRSTEMAAASFGQSPQLDNVGAIFAHKAQRNPSATRSELANIALVLVRFDHLSGGIVNANHGMM